MAEYEPASIMVGTIVEIIFFCIAYFSFSGSDILTSNFVAGLVATYSSLEKRGVSSMEDLAG
jgi:hypothetical protein